MGRQNTDFVVVESHSILYSSKIVCWQVDWFTGYNGIMIEHLWSGAIWNIGVHLKLLFSVNCQATIAFRAIRSLHYLWVCHTVHDIVPPQMWVHHIVRNMGPPHLGFPFLVGSPPSSLCNRSFQSYQNDVNSGSWQSWILSTIAFRATKILSIVGVDIPVNCSFQDYQNPDNFISWYSCSFHSYQKPGRHYVSRQLLELRT